MKKGLNLVFVLLLSAIFFVSCGGSGGGHTEPSKEKATSGEAPVTTSVQASDAREILAVEDRSEMVTGLFGGDLIGKNRSEMVYDLEHRYFENLIRIYANQGIQYDPYRVRKFPQVRFETEDAKAFNEMSVQLLAQEESMYASVLTAEVRLSEEERRHFAENGGVCENYGVIEGEKYLSVILVQASPLGDWKNPVYYLESYIFDKETGNLLTEEEIVRSVDEDGILVHEMAKLFRHINRSMMENYAFIPFNHVFSEFLKETWHTLFPEKEWQGGAGPFWGERRGFSFYADEDGEFRLLHVALEPKESDFGLYKWHANRILDYSLKDLASGALKIDEPEESELYFAVKEKFGISEDRDILIANIGIGDDLSVRKFQKFVDDFAVSLGGNGVLRDISYEGSDWRDVYILIPRYRYAVTCVGTNYDEMCGIGFAVIGVDQSEDKKAEIKVLYRSQAWDLELPVRYDEGETGQFGESEVYDFSDRLTPTEEPIRDEIEEFLFSVRTFG